MKRIFILLIGVLMSTQAIAEDSNLIQLDETNHQTVYGVKGTMVKENEYRTLWTKTLYKAGGAKVVYAETPKFQNASYTRQRWKVNCRSNEIASLQFVIYNNNGVSVYSEVGSNFEGVIPGSVGQIISDVACNDYGK